MVVVLFGLVSGGTALYNCGWLLVFSCSALLSIDLGPRVLLGVLMPRSN